MDGQHVLMSIFSEKTKTMRLKMFRPGRPNSNLHQTIPIFFKPNHFQIGSMLPSFSGARFFFRRKKTKTVGSTEVQMEVVTRSILAPLFVGCGGSADLYIFFL